MPEYEEIPKPAGKKHAEAKSGIIARIKLFLFIEKEKQDVGNSLIKRISEIFDSQGDNAFEDLASDGVPELDDKELIPGKEDKSDEPVSEDELERREQIQDDRKARRAENEGNRETALSGVRDLFDTPEEKKERIFETHKQERKDELKELTYGGSVTKARKQMIDNKIRLKKKEIARNREHQAQNSKGIIALGREKIELKKLQISLKKENQIKNLQDTEEKINLLESEIKLKEDEIILDKNEYEILQGELEDLESQINGTSYKTEYEPEDTESTVPYNYETESKNEDENESEEEYDHGYDYESEKRYSNTDLSENEITKDIFAKLNPNIKEEAKPWDKKIFEPFKAKDFVNTIKFLKENHSILLESDGYWKKLDADKLKLLMNSVSELLKSSYSEESENAMLPEEQEEIMKAGREETKKNWFAGAPQKSARSHPIYKDLIKIFPINEETTFFGEGEDNKDNLDKIQKVAEKLNTFKLFGNKPFKEFEEEVKDAVKINGSEIKNSRQTYINLREKINQILPIAKEHPTIWKNRENIEIKQCYDNWIKVIKDKDKGADDDMNERNIAVSDIDALLCNEKYEYLTRIENYAKKLMEKINVQWEKPDLKNQAIIEYFSEFLKQSYKIMTPIIEARSERTTFVRLQAMEEEGKYKKGSDKKSKSEEQKAEKPAGETNSWHNLRLTGRKYALALVKLCKTHEKDKNKLSGIKNEISEKFLQELTNQFDVHGMSPQSASGKIKKFESRLKNYRKKILGVVTEIDFDDTIKNKIQPNELKELEEEYYDVPDIR